jgi:hypothetical protein
MKVLAWVVAIPLTWVALQLLGTWRWFQTYQPLGGALYLAAYGVAGFCLIEALRTALAARRAPK